MWCCILIMKSGAEFKFNHIPRKYLNPLHRTQTAAITPFTTGKNLSKGARENRKYYLGIKKKF